MLQQWCLLEYFVHYQYQPYEYTKETLVDKISTFFAHIPRTVKGDALEVKSQAAGAPVDLWNAAIDLLDTLLIHEYQLLLARSLASVVASRPGGRGNQPRPFLPYTLPALRFPPFM